MKFPKTTLLAICCFSLAGSVSAQDRALHLSIGDPARKDRDAQVVLDAITDTERGDLLTPADLAARFAGVKLLLVGEEHTNSEFHRVQLQTIQAVVSAGRPVMIGLEMYPYTEQHFLDQWREGLLTEDGFLRLSRWYENWGYHWHYYRDIFLFARDSGIPLVAINTPREVVAAVRTKGFANLTPEEAKHIPTEVDVDSADHMAFFKATLSGEGGEGGMGGMMHGGSEEMWKSMLAAQATWDATMGWNAVKALEKASDNRTLMVVLVGSGHVAYGVGIERQVKRWYDGRVASLIPVPADSGPVSVRASYANFLWGVASEQSTRYPTLGMSTGAVPGSSARQVIQMDPDGFARQAGFQLKDVIVSMDGQPVPDRETLNRLTAAKRWGDGVTFVVRRGGQELTIKSAFRRSSK
ncbi:MAG: ChaN family lipoprotein [Vicinamibacterales bacterium]